MSRQDNIWMKYDRRKIIGKEPNNILYLNINVMEMISEKGKYKIELVRNMKYSYDSSQCKIMKVIIMANGMDRARNEVHCEKMEFNTKDIWFRNKQLLTEKATKMGLMVSAWC